MSGLRTAAGEGEARTERVATANAFLAVIASHGRRFFTHGGRVSQFELDARGRVWFRDDYTDRLVYTHTAPYQRWPDFSHGGTLRRLVERLRDFIMGRAPLPLTWVAPRTSFSEGDIWGYGEEASRRVREECAALAPPTTAQSNPTEPPK